MKRSFFSYTKLYFMMIAQDFKSKMAYRADFLISTLGMLLTNFAGLATFWLIFNSIPQIRGFGYEELLFMYSFSLLAATPMQLFFDNLWQLWIHCENGDFIKYCFKPLNLYFYYVAETFDAKGLGQFIFALIMFIYSWAKIGIAVTIPNILILLLTLLGASLVLIGIMTVASASAFVTIHGVTIMGLMNQFKDYARYPMMIFNSFFKFIFTFILPIGFISFYPSIFFLRPDQHVTMGIVSPLVGILVFFIGYFVWKKGALKYAGTGS